MYLFDLSQAENAVQETYLKAGKAMAKIKCYNGRSQKIWLTIITINLCLNHYGIR